ncbi:hypothetical protein BJX61DRAFT_375515 [Aspergillus egyptiacus]|nr:hypothetical protein BJX61DRAFT_375515 [Aspergillus egyptiacus]
MGGTFIRQVCRLSASMTHAKVHQYYRRWRYRRQPVRSEQAKSTGHFVSFLLLTIFEFFEGFPLFSTLSSSSGETVRNRCAKSLHMTFGSIG